MFRTEVLRYNSSIYCHLRMIIVIIFFVIIIIFIIDSKFYNVYGTHSVTRRGDGVIEYRHSSVRSMVEEMWSQRRLFTGYFIRSNNKNNSPPPPIRTRPGYIYTVYQEDYRDTLFISIRFKCLFSLYQISPIHWTGHKTSVTYLGPKFRTGETEVGEHDDTVTWW